MLAECWLKTSFKYRKYKKIDNYLKFANVGVMLAQSRLEILKMLGNLKLHGICQSWRNVGSKPVGNIENVTKLKIAWICPCWPNVG